MEQIINFGWGVVESCAATIVALAIYGVAMILVLTCLVTVWFGTIAVAAIVFDSLADWVERNGWN